MYLGIRGFKTANEAETVACTWKLEVPQQTRLREFTPLFVRTQFVHPCMGAAGTAPGRLDQTGQTAKTLVICHSWRGLEEGSHG